MTIADAASTPAALSGRNASDLVARSLTRRRARERRFHLLAMAALIVGVGLVVFLFGTILMKGIPAFFQARIQTEIFLDPARLKVPPRPQQEAGQSNAAYQQALYAWQNRLTLANWNSIIEDALRQELPNAKSGTQLRGLVASSERFRIRDMVIANPDIIGQRVPIDLLADANVDVWLKGNIARGLNDNQYQMSADQRAWADQLYESGVISMAFNSGLFFNVDSRSSPASAGLAGAFMGSAFMMLIVIVLAVPIGIAGAIYLEEFAPKNRITDLIEVNINNLAAVPSIVFGLLGASLFINWLRLPISAPIVGGLVLSLMTLPTVIIATRAALKAVPPSIRQAALGLGASQTQSVFNHVLPLALPGIMTATIIGVAQALGETAPLLLIGMNAFVPNVPTTPFDQATALPVQIYLWQGNELRNFFEARTSAAIIVLLAMMITLNGLALFLRRKFERRW